MNYIRHHFLPGEYRKEIGLTAGSFVEQHKHTYDHTSILAAGTVLLNADGAVSVHHAPKRLLIAAGIAHKITALTDSVWFCCHKTEETDPEKIDAAVILKEEH